MKIRDLFQSPSRRLFSFEFFPPKTDAGMVSLERTIAELTDLAPAYVSVTYGAGGSTRERTIELVTRIQQRDGLCAMAHLTCVGATEAELGEVLDRLVEAGIENIMALRGDPPQGQERFVQTAGGFAHATDLIAFIRRRFGGRLSIGAAGYPEAHVESRAQLGHGPLALADDIRHLRAKAEAGADFIVTQLFFDNRAYFDYVARARAAGITIPIVPGIMPIRNVAQIERFTRLCGASIPPALFAELDRRRDSDEAVAALGVAHATAQCVELLHGGAPGIHFYTLNQSPATRVILTALKACGLA